MDDTQFSEGGRTSGFVVGLLCGAAVGATLGLLFAPKTGTELRRDIADGAGKLRRRAEEAYGKASDAIERGMDRASRMGEDAVDDLASRGRQAARRASNLVDQARSTMNAPRRTGNGSETIS